MGRKRGLHLQQRQSEKGVCPGPLAADLAGIEKLAAGMIDVALPPQPAIDKGAFHAANWVL